MTSRVLGVGITGTHLTELERSLLEQFTPSAVILFARNVESPTQLRDLVAEIKTVDRVPPLILIDEEGGRVDRLRRLIPGLPGAEELGASGDARAMTAWFGRVAGRALRWFGIDVNLAPVVDVQREVQSKGLERRCFGSDAGIVTDLALAFMLGQESQGVASCLKHFPGIGASSADPHYGTSVVSLAFDEVDRVDMAPYRILAERTSAVMIGHSIYPNLDDGVPATLSRRISTRLLREEIGFTGLAVSDDMEMHAVSDLGSSESVAERAIEAGSDLILFCSQIERFPEVVARIESRATNDPWFAGRIDEALIRVAAFRKHCARLRVHTRAAASFESVIEEAGQFVHAFASGGAPAPDVRQGGTGKTGREEWT